jgi:hypothetical protein
MKQADFAFDALTALISASRAAVEEHEKFPLYTLSGKPRLRRATVQHVRVRMSPVFLQQLLKVQMPPQKFFMPDGREIPLMYEEKPPVPPGKPAEAWCGATTMVMSITRGELRGSTGCMIALPVELRKQP